MKLSTKIHIFTTVLMLILLVLTNIGIYYLFERLAFNTEYEQLKDRGEKLVMTLSQLEVNTDPIPVLRAYMPIDGAVHVLDEKGNIKTSVEASIALKNAKVTEYPDTGYHVGEVDGTSFIGITISTIWVDGSVVKIELLQLLYGVDRNMQLLRLILIAVTLIATIPILMSSILLSRIILRPLGHLSETMKKSASSGTYEKIQEAIDRKDELGEIGRSFNGMMDALESNYKKQQQFVSNASHELKTPLTVIESYAKLLLRQGFSNEKVAKEALDAIVSESSRMNEMIVQMLELAKNREHRVLNVKYIDLIATLQNTLSQMSQAYNRHFELHGVKQAAIQSDEHMLRQLLFIILDNARKYSDDQIVVNVEQQSTGYKVAIRAFGRGIPTEQLPHLFDRFYRVSEDRNRKTGGTGLGLSIAKEVSDILQIDIKVESEVGVGTCFMLHVPAVLEKV